MECVFVVCQGDEKRFRKEHKSKEAVQVDPRWRMGDESHHPGGRLEGEATVPLEFHFQASAEHVLSATSERVPRSMRRGSRTSLPEGRVDGTCASGVALDLSLPNLYMT